MDIIFIMNDPVNLFTLELRDALGSLKSEIDCLKDYATKNGGLDKEQTQLTFHNNVLPNLLRLRGLNRRSKDSLEKKYDDIRNLNRVLVNLTESCENIIYEVSSTDYEINMAKKRLAPTRVSAIEGQPVVKLEPETNGHNERNYFDPEKVAELDHATRLQKLDEEELKRRKLQDTLNEVTEEVLRMNEVPKMAESRLNRVKPYIKQLVERVDDLLQDT